VNHGEHKDCFKKIVNSVNFFLSVLCGSLCSL
jgi:hypothetical protein